MLKTGALCKILKVAGAFEAKIEFVLDKKQYEHQNTSSTFYRSCLKYAVFESSEVQVFLSLNDDE